MTIKKVVFNIKNIAFIFKEWVIVLTQMLVLPIAAIAVRIDR